MKNALDDALSTVAVFVPKLVAFLVILIIGLIVARLIAKALDAVLERVGFDKVVERGGVKRALESSTFDASDIVSKLVYYALVLFVLQTAFGVFGPNPVSDLLTRVIAFLPSLVVAVIIVIITAAVAAGAKTLIEGTLGGLSYGSVLANIASVFILFLGIIAALNQVGVATTVTTPVLVTILATLGGVIVVGVGSGLIKPMQQRWEDYLKMAEQEAPKLRQQASTAPSASEQAHQAVSGAVYDVDAQTAPATYPTGYTGGSTRY